MKILFCLLFPVMLFGQVRTHTYLINDTLASVYWQDIIQKYVAQEEKTGSMPDSIQSVAGLYDINV